MYSQWVQSVEEYKGFTLEVLLTRFAGDDHPHRSCRVLKNGVEIAYGRTKKGFKDLIDSGVYD
jgi:hypothetical protein